MPLGDRIAYLKKAKRSIQGDFEFQDPQFLRSFHHAQELPQEDEGIDVRFVEALSTKQRMERVLQGVAA